MGRKWNNSTLRFLQVLRSYRPSLTSESRRETQDNMPPDTAPRQLSQVLSLKAERRAALDRTGITAAFRPGSCALTTLPPVRPRLHRLGIMQSRLSHNPWWASATQSALGLSGKASLQGSLSNFPMEARPFISFHHFPRPKELH